MRGEIIQFRRQMTSRSRRCRRDGTSLGPGALAKSEYIDHHVIVFF